MFVKIESSKNKFIMFIKKWIYHILNVPWIMSQFTIKIIWFNVKNNDGY